MRVYQTMNRGNGPWSWHYIPSVKKKFLNLCQENQIKIPAVSLPSPNPDLNLELYVSQFDAQRSAKLFKYKTRTCTWLGRVLDLLWEFIPDLEGGLGIWTGKEDYLNAKAKVHNPHVCEHEHVNWLPNLDLTLKSNNGFGIEIRTRACQ